MSARDISLHLYVCYQLASDCRLGLGYARLQSYNRKKTFYSREFTIYMKKRKRRNSKVREEQELKIISEQTEQKKKNTDKA